MECVRVKISFSRIKSFSPDFSLGESIGSNSELYLTPNRLPYSTIKSESSLPKTHSSIPRTEHVKMMLVYQWQTHAPHLRTILQISVSQESITEARGQPRTCNIILNIGMHYLQK